TDKLVCSVRVTFAASSLGYRPLRNARSSSTFKGTGPAMTFITKLLLAFISLTSVLLRTSYGAAPPQQTKVGSANESHTAKNPVHLIVRCPTDIKQTFTYSPRSAVLSELQG